MQKKLNMLKKILPALTLLLVVCSASVAVAQPLKPGERIAVVGDSTTYYKMYTRAIECYLLVSGPQTEFRFMQAGVSGDTADKFSNRMETDLIHDFKPTLLMNFYGTSDVAYRPYSDALGEQYRTALTKIYARMKKENIRVIEGGPEAFDAALIKNRTPEAVIKINDSLMRLSGIAEELAKENGYVFTGHHALAVDVMKRAKAEHGNDYPVISTNGVYPQTTGHLVVAYGFLKALGLDGSIGTITVDLKGKATATDGHQVIQAGNGSVLLESTRYPFCFFDESNDPFTRYGRSGNRSILPFLPFNEDLNRYMLVVKNLTADKAQVTWGSETKVFTREQLTQGINLAAEFLDNPFLEPFLALDKAVGEKQDFESSITSEIRGLTSLAQKMNNHDKFTEITNEMRAHMLVAQEKYSKQVRESVKPVRHTISVKPL